ncbi:hypothetical protein KH5_00100 [Urechidicola sp. KH5]
MNKKVKILIGIICGILVLLQFTSLLGWLKLYTNSTIANEPNLKFESRMLVSNLISPSNGDFVCYNYEDEYFGMGIRVHRLIAKEGDIVEIINGEAYVNKINVDKSLNLMHLYIIDSVQFNTAKRNGLINENTIGSMSHSNEFIITFDDRVAKEYGLKNRVIKKDSIPMSNIQSKFNKS